MADNPVALVGAGDKTDPSQKSLDRQALDPHYVKVTAILGGTTEMRKNAETYLPKLPDEPAKNYEFRKAHAKFTNVFADITEGLSQKPFAKEVQLSEDSDQQLWDLAEDIDGRGSDLNHMAGTIFNSGINYGLDWVLVEYANAPNANRTREQERLMGVRPYWVRYKAPQVLAIRSAVINGKEEFVHVRLQESNVAADQFSETRANRVRVIERQQTAPGVWGGPTWKLWERQQQNGRPGSEWVMVDEGVYTIPVIPLVPFVCGRRMSGWQVKPPMMDAADLQIELFQQESALKNIRALAGFPMLSGNGVTPELDESGNPKNVPVGPHVVLYAPPHAATGQAGSWAFVQPDPQLLVFLAQDIKDTIKELRELGRQPLTAQSGNLTVVTTAFAAQKGNAAIQSWALLLKNCLEQAMEYTAMWLNISDPAKAASVLVDTDFDLGLGDDDSFTHVREMRRDGDISRDAELAEAKRRGILSADFDPEEDAKLLLGDMEDDTQDNTGDEDGPGLKP